MRNFKGGNAIFTNPNTPIKCGGAPQKIMYLAGDYILKNGLQPKSNIHFYSGGSIIFGVKKYADTLNKVLLRYKIQTHFKHNLVEIDGPGKRAWFEDEHGNRVVEKISAGSLACIPKGAHHSTFNTGWEPMRILAVYSPPGPETFMRESAEFRVLPAGEVPVRA